MILSICDNPSVLSVIDIIKTIIQIIRIAVPIILILSCMISYMKAIKDDDELAKTSKLIVNKVISAVLIFLIPTFVNIIGYVTGSEDFKECLHFGSNNSVTNVYEDKINELIDKVKETGDYNDYLNLKNYLNQIRDRKIRDKYDPILEEIYNEYFVTEGVCSGSYENGYGLAKLEVDVTKGNGVKYKFKIGNRVVQDSDSPTYKARNMYELLINPSVEITSQNGRVSKIDCVVKHNDYEKYDFNGYYFHKKGAKDVKNKINNPVPNNSIPYFLYIPKTAGTNNKVPLILALHGGYGISTCYDGKKYVTTTEATQTNHHLKHALYYRDQPINNSYDYPVNAVVIAPSNSTCNWEGSIFGALDLAYSYVKLYNIDVDSVIVTGSSQGGYGTLYAGFLDEQVIYKTTNNETTLESVASMYGVSKEDVINYNKKLSFTINYSDNTKTTLKNGSYTIIKAKGDSDVRSLFAMLVPLSPAKNASRCVFTPSTVYDKEPKCQINPPYILKTPIWIVSSNDEYDKIQQFAKELTAYYEKHSDIRYTVLTKLRDPHYTNRAIWGRTSAIDFVTSVKYGQFKVRNNSTLDAIERSLGSNFVGDWHPGN